MNKEMMNDYIEYVADRLMVELGISIDENIQSDEPKQQNVDEQTDQNEVSSIQEIDHLRIQ